MRTADTGIDGTGNYVLTLAHTPGAAPIVSPGDEGGALVNGANHAGAITIGDLDQWTFTAAAGDAITASIGKTGGTAEFTPWIRVRSPSGAVLGQDFGALAAQVTVTATTAGTYTVLVGTADSGVNGTGNYMLTLAHTPGAAPVVSAGDEGGALINGANHTGTITSATSISGRSRRRRGTRSRRAWARPANPEFTPWIRIRAPNGTLLGQDFNALAAQVTVTATTAGTYTVLVGTADSGVNGTGNYVLTLAHTPGAAPIVSAGDEGGALINGANHTGAITIGDVDQWMFTAAAGNAIIVSIAKVAGDAEFTPWIRVRAPNGAQIGAGLQCADRHRSPSPRPPRGSTPS